ncbi:MarR family transcriptional regulator [Vitreimonas sp.]|jgi:DNA-binding MarR family transcriptional regulator|uniref:MarR family winged helix-turn-helix transcriptional regulator n=1 Tax=Vitreimonas sp. TaxID=3069702 RepID=UPI002ED87D09
MTASRSEEASLLDTRLAGLGFAIADATRLMRSAFDARMRQVGLRGSSWRVLAYLYRQDGLSQTELARLLEITRAGAGQMIDQLEASGHVRRKSDPADGRRWRVYLDPRIRETMAQVFDVVRRFDEDLCAAFTDDELEALRALIERLRDRASAMGAIRAAPDS